MIENFEMEVVYPVRTGMKDRLNRYGRRSYETD
jgi:hypothetical protein